ncbi:MAG: hypothetical protein QM831_04790 [Kofleriaceae bacterium]
MRLALISMVAAGCAGPGAMHQATLAGQCAEGDATCSRTHPLAPLAIGARFHPQVDVEVAGTATPNLRLESADPAIVSVEDGVLVGHAPGASAVLITTDDGSIVDFVHVWVAKPTSLSLARRDGDRIANDLDLAVGDDVTLAPALWAGVQQLTGDAQWTWTSSNPNVLEILRDGSTDRRRLRAHAAGKSTVTVAFGDMTTTLNVEVMP